MAKPKQFLHTCSLIKKKKKVMKHLEMLLRPSELVQGLEILEFQLVLDFKIKFLDLLDIQTEQFCHKI